MVINLNLNTMLMKYIWQKQVLYKSMFIILDLDLDLHLTK